VSESTLQALDRLEIEGLITDWARWRDNGDWPALLQTFHPGGVIEVSWFRGPFTEFVEASRRRAEERVFAKHIMAGSSIQIARPRAVSETEVLLITDARLDGPGQRGGELTIVSSLRFLDHVRLGGDGRWRLQQRTAIYDADWPGGGEPPPAAELAAFPAPYRLLAWRLAHMGAAPPADLPTRQDDRVRRLRQAARDWLRGGGEYPAP
jgi:hypothetical protein